MGEGSGGELRELARTFPTALAFAGALRGPTGEIGRIFAREAFAISAR